MKNKKLGLTYDPEEWRELSNWIKEWDEHENKKKKGRDLPDPSSTISKVYLLPLTIALMRSQKQAEKYNKALIFLTLVLAILAIIQIVILLS